MALEKVKTWAERVFTPDKAVQRRFLSFQHLLQEDRKCLKLVTRLEEIVHRPFLTDWQQISLLARALSASVQRLIRRLMDMRPDTYDALTDSHARIAARLEALLPKAKRPTDPPYALDLGEAWESPELLGGKGLALARIRHATTISLPPGFVITTNAFHAFLHENDLEGLIARHLRGLSLRDPKRLRKCSENIRRAIMQGAVPDAVRESIVSAMGRIAGAGRPAAWAVRSSAVAEDGAVSFAGQYASVLDVQDADMLTAYKTVLASKYGSRALTYRLHYGLDDGQTPMAVLVLPMITPRVSGVLYSLDPLDMCRGKCLVISAIPGLGARLVEGSAVPDIFLVSRQDPERFLAKHPAPRQDAAEPDSFPRAEKISLCLDDASAASLARWGLALEALFGSPQDVEWTQAQSGDLLVLQSRPIHVSRTGQAQDDSLGEHDQTPQPADHIATLIDVGTPASVGIASGPVHRLAGEADLERVPPDSIVVTASIPPSLVHLVRKVRAVLAEQGGKASHFASVAREFGLPLIVGLGDMAGTLQEGQIVTVDAYRGVVYEGKVRDLLSWQEKNESKPRIPFQDILAPLMDLVSPLNLTDPASSDFAPDNCRTFHDVIRFVHEKGTQEMFSLVDAKGRGLRRAKSLESELPMVMYVLDLGEGLSKAARGKKAVSPGDFQSAPMQAVWAGLTDRDIRWSKGLLHLDWERFDQVSGGIFSMKSSLLASYALVAEHYVHLLLRFGYHFAVLDALSGDRPEENHIQFRFKGGGGAPEKKTWRLAMLDKVLTHFGFGVKIQEDMLEARCMRLDFKATQLRLQILGYLLGRTPLLDMALESEDHALGLADELAGKWLDTGKEN